MRIALTVLFSSCLLASLAQVEDELTLNFDLGYQRALRLDPYQSDIRQNGHWLVGSGGFTDISGLWMNYLEGGGHGGFPLRQSKATTPSEIMEERSITNFSTTSGTLNGEEHSFPVCPV